MIRKLAGQTAIYGLSSIIGRLLNYLLVPLYTYTFAPEAYGTVTELYAYAGFLMVLFTYGMETAFFRYSGNIGNPRKVFSTAFTSLLFTTLLLSGVLIAFRYPIAARLHYSGHEQYIVWFALIIGLDALASIPFARLRAEEKPVRFATVKVLNIGINIGLNLFFIVLCPWILRSEGLSAFHAIIGRIYDPTIGVGYIFISNLVASAATLLILLPELRRSRLSIDPVLWRKMVLYSLPLMFVGFAGIINEMLDRVLLKFLLPYSIEKNTALLGIYGANYKLSILLTLFIQAFRYAAEPFFFQQAGHENAPKLYARVLNWFVIAGMCIFLFILLYLDILKYFIGPKYHSGLNVVPILLMANLMLGIYYNLSIWYKLTDKTVYGALISIGGAVITVVLNILWIPVLGYMGSAWATLICYGSMVLASWWLGRKYYPVPYKIARIAGYILLGSLIYLAAHYLIDPLLPGRLLFVLRLVIHTLLLLLYVLVILIVEKPFDRASGKAGGK